VAYSQEVPEGVARKAYFDSEVLKRVISYGADESFYGDHIDLYDTGELRYEAPYENGKINGIVKEYFKSGKLKGEANFKDGKKNGIEKLYYENEQLHLERNFKDGKKNGIAKYYNESGLLESEGEFKDDKLHGIFKIYDESGQLEAEENFKDGKSIDYMEIVEFASQHEDFEEFRPTMYKISLDPKNENLTIQELYDEAKRQVNGTSTEINKDKAVGTISE